MDWRTMVEGFEAFGISPGECLQSVCPFPSRKTVTPIKQTRRSRTHREPRNLQLGTAKHIPHYAAIAPPSHPNQNAPLHTPPINIAHLELGLRLPPGPKRGRLRFRYPGNPARQTRPRARHRHLLQAGPRDLPLGLGRMSLNRGRGLCGDGPHGGFRSGTEPPQPVLGLFRRTGAGVGGGVGGGIVYVFAS